MAEVRELFPQSLENHENEQKSEISKYCKPPKLLNCDTIPASLMIFTEGIKNIFKAWQEVNFDWSVSDTSWSPAVALFSLRVTLFEPFESGK